MRSRFLFFGFAVLILVGCAEETQTFDMSNDAILDSALVALDRSVLDDSVPSDFDLGVDAFVVLDAEVVPDVASDPRCDSQ